MKVILLLLLISTQAFANIARISRGGFALPASDLMYRGEQISPERARDLKSQGIDISSLEPKVEARGLWENRLGEDLDPSLDAKNIADGDSVRFQGILRSAPGEFRFTVTTNNREIISI